MLNDIFKKVLCSPPSCHCIVLSKDSPVNINLNLDNMLDIYDNEIDGLLLRVEATTADDIVSKLSDFIAKLQEALESGEIHDYLETQDDN